jgi:hypothetical protein
MRQALRFASGEKFVKFIEGGLMRFLQITKLRSSLLELASEICGMGVGVVDGCRTPSLL